ncbi:sporulation protein YjcZ [Bacillus thuringiensis]|nr:sporulation protein YjcZ [Bacillus thuringiensis]
MNPSFALLSKGGTIIMGYGGTCGEGCGFALLVVLFMVPLQS